MISNQFVSAVTRSGSAYIRSYVDLDKCLCRGFDDTFCTRHDRFAFSAKDPHVADRTLIADVEKAESGNPPTYQSQVIFLGDVVTWKNGHLVCRRLYTPLKFAPIQNEFPKLAADNTLAATGRRIDTISRTTELSFNRDVCFTHLLNNWWEFTNNLLRCTVRLESRLRSLSTGACRRLRCRGPRTTLVLRTSKAV